jgi:hypothetical protein
VKLGSFTHKMGGDLMNMGSFMLVGLVVAGVQIVPAAAAPVSTTPLIIEKTEQELLALSVRQAIQGDVQKQADLINYLQQSNRNCDACEGDITTRHLGYAAVSAKGAQRWQDQGSVGLSLRSGPTSFGVWGDVREVNAVKNDEQQLLPSTLTTNATVPSALSTQITPSDASAVVNSDVSTSSLRLNNPGATTAQVRGDGLTTVPLRVGSVSGVAPSVATRAPVSTVRNTSDLAYKEYVGGLFMSQSF